MFACVPPKGPGDVGVERRFAVDELRDAEIQKVDAPDTHRNNVQIYIKK